MIVNTEIRQDVNGIMIWKIGKCIKSYELIVKIDNDDEYFGAPYVKAYSNNEFIFYYDKNNLGFVKYGLEYIDGKENPDNGKGIWSSNPTAVKRILNKDIIDIVLVSERGIRFASAMTVEKAREFITDEYVLIEIEGAWRIISKEDVEKI